MQPDNFVFCWSRFDEIRRRVRKERLRSDNGTGESSNTKFEPASKRVKVEEEEEGDSEDDDMISQSHSAVDINEKFVMERLNPIVAAEMVITKSLEIIIISM